MAEPNAEGGLVNSLQVLLESGRDADVTIVVGGSELPAHSVILAARSPVFAAALRHDTREARTRRIEVVDVQEAVLKQLLCFMYTDTAPQMESMAAELLSAADKYDLPLLKKRCEQTLARDLTVDNAAATALLAEMHCCQLLKNATVDFIVSHPQVMATEGWVNVMRGNVEAATQICKKMSEERRDLMERLLRAATNGSVREIRALLRAGATVYAKDGSGNTPLHLAVWNNNAAAVKLLIDAGADVNVRNSNQKTPLHRAVHARDMGIMWMLLAVSACIDAQDEEGDTPLHDAACDGNHEKVQALLVSGANRDIKNTNGKKAYERANSSTQAVFNIY